MDMPYSGKVLRGSIFANRQSSHACGSCIYKCPFFCGFNFSGLSTIKATKIRPPHYTVSCNVDLNCIHSQGIFSQRGEILACDSVPILGHALPGKF